MRYDEIPYAEMSAPPDRPMPTLSRGMNTTLIVAAILLAPLVLPIAIFLICLACAVADKLDTRTEGVKAAQRALDRIGK